MFARRFVDDVDGSDGDENERDYGHGEDNVSDGEISNINSDYNDEGDYESSYYEDERVSSREYEQENRCACDECNGGRSECDLSCDDTFSYGQEEHERYADEDDYFGEDDDEGDGERLDLDRGFDYSAEFSSDGEG